MGKNKQRGYDDYEAEHANKVNFKQYLQNLEEEALEVDDEPEIVSSSSMTLEGSYRQITFGYNGRDGQLVFSEEVWADIKDLDHHEELTFEDSGVSWYVKNNGDGFITFDSGFEGIFGRAARSDLIKKFD